MKHARLSALSAAIACIALLSACAEAPPKPSPGAASMPPAPPLAEPLAVEPAPPTTNDAPSRPPTPAEQQQAQKLAVDVAALLEAGEVEKARAEAEKALKLDRANRLAQTLLEQITTPDPVAKLGRESVSYTVRPGETLSSIAGAFMKDIYAFYILARYNEVAVPRTLHAGQVLRIPRSSAAAGRVAEPSGGRGGRTVGTSGTSGTVGTSVVTTGTTATTGPAGPTSSIASTTAISTATPTPTPTATTTTTTTASATAPAPSPLVAAALTQPKLAAPTPPSAQPSQPPQPPSPPSPPPRPIPGQGAFDAALSAERAGQVEDAYNGFRRAEADGHPAAGAKVAAMRKALIERHAAAARTAMARQDPEGAVRAWDRVLALDPQQDAAKLERQRALKVQENFERLSKAPTSTPTAR